MQTGLRLSELTSLRRGSLVLDTTPYVRCIGKGRKERCTPLTKQAVAVLNVWLKEPPRKGSDILFTTLEGNSLSADAVQHLVKKYISMTGKSCSTISEKHVSPHVLRHSAAMELVHAGVDSTVLALWLGHESIDTTQIYIHAHLALKEAALSKTDPLKTNAGRFKAGDHLLQFLSTL